MAIAADSGWSGGLAIAADSGWTGGLAIAADSEAPEGVAIAADLEAPDKALTICCSSFYRLDFKDISNLNCFGTLTSLMLNCPFSFESVHIKSLILKHSWGMSVEC